MKNFAPGILLLFTNMGALRLGSRPKGSTYEVIAHGQQHRGFGLLPLRLFGVDLLMSLALGMVFCVGSVILFFIFRICRSASMTGHPEYARTYASTL